MEKQVEKMFVPCVILYWRGYFGNLRKLWYPKDTEHESIMRVIMDRAGIDSRNGVHITEKQYDRFLEAASDFGYSVEMIDKIGEHDIV